MAAVTFDREGNCTHIHVRKGGVQAVGGDLFPFWACTDCMLRFEPMGVSGVAELADLKRVGVIDAANMVGTYRRRAILSARIRNEQWYLVSSGRGDCYLNARTLSELQDLIDKELGDRRKHEKRDGAVQEPADATPQETSAALERSTDPATPIGPDR